jgi:hypothetical protein
MDWPSTWWQEKANFYIIKQSTPSSVPGITASYLYISARMADQLVVGPGFKRRPLAAYRVCHNHPAVTQQSLSKPWP